MPPVIKILTSALRMNATTSEISSNNLNDFSGFCDLTGLCHNWQNIAQYCNIPELASLWRTSKWMQAVLKDANHLQGQGIFQPCLKDLRGLEVLCLQSHPKLTCDKLTMLPRSLHTLELTMEDYPSNSNKRFDWNLMHSSILIDGTYVGLPSSLTKLTIVSDGWRLLNLASLPKRLCDLTIKGSVEISFSSIEDLDQPHFKDLHTLRIIQDTRYGTVTTRECGNMTKILWECPNLTRLEVGDLLQGSIFKMPPLPLLTSMKLIVKEEAHVSVLKEWLSSCSANVDMRLKLTGTLDRGLSFPLKLTSITLKELTQDNLIQFLPLTLTSIDVNYDGNDTHLFSRFHILTSLTIKNHNILLIEKKFSCDLPSLKKLTTVNYFNIKVPASVTDLAITFTKNPPSFSFRQILSSGCGVGITNKEYYHNAIEWRKIRRPLAVISFDYLQQRFHSLIGVDPHLLVGMSENFTQHLTTLKFTTYSDDLYDILSRLPTHQLKTLRISDNTITTHPGMDFVTLLQLCHRFSELEDLRLKLLNLSTVASGQSRMVYDTEILLPPRLELLHLVLGAELRGLKFHDKLTDLKLLHTSCFTTQQLLQLSCCPLVNVEIAADISQDLVWDILNSLPLCTQWISFTIPFNEMLRQVPFQYYAQSRRHYLHTLVLATAM